MDEEFIGQIQKLLRKILPMFSKNTKELTGITWEKKRPLVKQRMLSIGRWNNKNHIYLGRLILV